jgi:hypothetical protein
MSSQKLKLAPPSYMHITQSTLILVPAKSLDILQLFCFCSLQPRLSLSMSNVSGLFISAFLNSHYTK